MSTTTDGGHDALTNSRFQVLSNPEYFPARCNICGVGGVPVVSWGLRVERVGAIMFCLECMRQGGEAIGMVPRETYEESMDHLEHVVSTLTGERDAYKRQIEDENIGDDLNSRVRDAVIAALSDDGVLDGLKERLAPVGAPGNDVQDEPGDSDSIFKL